MQWYLLKDMLDTHRCHHLLLAKSRPMEWVDKIPFHGEGRCRVSVAASWLFHVVFHFVEHRNVEKLQLVV